MLRGVIYCSVIVASAVMRFLNVDIMTFFYVVLGFSGLIGIVEYKERKLRHESFTKDKRRESNVIH